MIAYREPFDVAAPVVPLAVLASPFGEIAKVALLIVRVEANRKCSPMAHIQWAVCQRFGLTHNDLVCDRRHRHIARPRQIAMYLCREFTPRSLPQIGRAFGDRDHTTVIHACRTIERLRSADPTFDATVRELESELAR